VGLGRARSDDEGHSCGASGPDSGASQQTTGAEGSPIMRTRAPVDHYSTGKGEVRK
jgi:hypothetical protein